MMNRQSAKAARCGVAETIRRAPWSAIPAVLLVATVASTAGCDATFYALHAAAGELAVQGQTEPIDDVLASGRLTDEQEEKLRLLVKARQYAVDTIGLRGGGSYETFYDTAGDPLAWSLSAARKDRLVPKTWVFWVMGEVPYLAFFDKGYLDDVREQLEADGLDTFVYELDAYSTLGLLDDPVRSPMLERDEISIVDTVIHELLHNTIWRPGAATFNESLATFVGREGAVAFLQKEFGSSSNLPAIARDLYADLDLTNSFLTRLYDDLTAFYDRTESRAERVSGREAVYEAARQRFTTDVSPQLHFPSAFAHLASLPTNNAWLLGHYRYNLNLDVFGGVLTAVDGDWHAALDVYRAAANEPGDPFAYLEKWVREHAE